MPLEIYRHIFEFLNIADIGSIYMAAKYNSNVMEHLTHQLFYDIVKNWFNRRLCCKSDICGHEELPCPCCKTTNMGPDCQTIDTKKNGKRSCCKNSKCDHKKLMCPCCDKKESYECRSLVKKCPYCNKDTCTHEYLSTKWNFKNREKEVANFINRLSKKKHCFFCFHKIQQTSTREKNENGVLKRIDKLWISQYSGFMKYMSFNVPQCIECFRTRNKNQLLPISDACRMIRKHTEFLPSLCNGRDCYSWSCSHDQFVSSTTSTSKTMRLLQIMTENDGVRHIIRCSNKGKITNSNGIIADDNVYVIKKVFLAGINNARKAIDHKRNRWISQIQALFNDDVLKPCAITLSLQDRDLNTLVSDFQFNKMIPFFEKDKSKRVKHTVFKSHHANNIKRDSVLTQKCDFYFEKFEIDRLRSTNYMLLDYVSNLDVVQCIQLNQIDIEFIRIIQSCAETLFHIPYKKKGPGIYKINPCYQYLKMCINLLSKEKTNRILPKFLNTTDIMFVVLKYIKSIQCGDTVNDVFMLIEDRLFMANSFWGPVDKHPSIYYRHNCKGKVFIDRKINKMKMILSKLSEYFDITHDILAMSNKKKKEKRKIDESGANKNIKRKKYF